MKLAQDLSWLAAGAVSGIVNQGLRRLSERLYLLSDVDQFAARGLPIPDGL